MEMAQWSLDTIGQVYKTAYDRLTSRERHQLEHAMVNLQRALDVLDTET